MGRKDERANGERGRGNQWGGREREPMGREEEAANGEEYGTTSLEVLVVSTQRA